MPVDPEEGLITDLMLGMMVVFGADIIALVGFMWLSGKASTAAFVGVTGLIVGVFAAWIAWRWKEIRRLRSTSRTALDELKYQYAAGNVSEAEFERKLDRLIETDDAVAAKIDTTDDGEIDIDDLDLAVDR